MSNLNIDLTLIGLSLAQLSAVHRALYDNQSNSDVVGTVSTGVLEEAAKEAEANQDAATTQTKVQSFGDVLLDILSDPRYELRSLEGINEQLDRQGFFGFDYEFDLEAHLREYGIAFYTKVRRSDGAKLFGLVKEPVNATAATQPQPTEITAFDKVIELLEDPRYTWRTVDTILEKSGVANYESLKSLLELNDVDYEYGTRTSDNKPIIGLSSRV